MTPTDSQNFDDFVPAYSAVPEKWEDARVFIGERFKQMASAINVREIGWMLDVPQQTGKQFYLDQNTTYSNTEFRTVFRTVVPFGALPNATEKSEPHGIDFNGNFSLVQMWLSATDPTDMLAFTVSYWAMSTPGDIILNMDVDNVNVTTKSNYSNYTISYICIEYLLEV